MSDQEVLKLSYSKCQTFKACRKKYKWRYVEKLYPKEKSKALKLGDVLHQMLDLYYRQELQTEHIKELPEFVRSLYPETEEQMISEISGEVARLFYAYMQKFEDDPTLQILHPEMHMELDIGEDILLYTRLDGIGITQDQRKWRVEHKTAARMDSKYLQGQRRGLQTGIAHWIADELLDEPLAGTFFNIFVKTKVPQINRTPVLKQRWLINMTKECVYGIARSIRGGDLYPSLECDEYSGCEYHILCSSYSDANVDAFFTRGEEVHDKETESSTEE